MKVIRVAGVFVVALLLLASGAVEAGKPINRPERAVVGQGRDLVVVPDLDDAVRVGGRTLQVHGLPTAEMGTVDLPLLAVVIGRQDERALARAHQNPYLPHLNLPDSM